MRITGSPDVLFAPNTPGAFGGLGLSAGDLPGDWSNYTANEKIAYFNENAINAGELLAAGVSQSDIDWMQSNGYTGQPAAKQQLTVPAAVTLPAGVEYAQAQAQAQQTQTVIVGGVTLPSDWTRYTPAQKITYFNQNSITPEVLIAEGVTADDIAWMKTQGYTGKPKAITSTTQTTSAAGGAVPLILAAAAAYFFGG